MGGQCYHSPIQCCGPDNGVCNDNEVCTVDDHCNNGPVNHCPNKPPGTCCGYWRTDCPRDFNVCTNDYCKAGVGCVIEPANGFCGNDGDPCTYDYCYYGQCQATAPRNDFACMTDNNVCTQDKCQGGQCIHPPAPGSDGDPCTSDGNVCTRDICEEGECTHPPKCAPGQTCCSNGDCVPSGQLCCSCASGGLQCCSEEYNYCCPVGWFCCGYPPGIQCCAYAGCADDGDPCTNDSCMNGQPVNSPKCPGQQCCANGACCNGLCDGCTNYGTLSGGTIDVEPDPACLGETIIFTLSGVTDTGGRKNVNCVDTVIQPALSYTWVITMPDGSQVSGAGDVATLTADLPGTYSCTFTATASRECAPPPSSIGPETADVCPSGSVVAGTGPTCGQKVPLGASVSLTGDGTCYRVYVPTKWGGKLNAGTTAGSITGLAYPDGSPYANNTETGEGKHGWYTFKVVGAASYTVSASFTQEGQATKRPWNFYWWSAKADYIREPAGGNGVADTSAAASDLQQIPPGMPAGAGADIVLSGTDGTLETGAGGDDERRTLINLFDMTGLYQPLLKYDLRHGTAARAWEAANHQAGFEWCGHCIGGSIASITLEQPAPVAGSAYNADELEGLWSELGEHSGGHVFNDPVFGIPAGPPVPGADDTDDFAPSFHGVLEKYVKSGGKALYAQLRSDGGTADQVWNHAVFKFSATFEEAPGGDEKVVKITNLVTANDDHAPPTGDLDTRDPQYVYIISYDAGGLPDAARPKDWISVGGDASFAPWGIAVIVAPSWLANNPNVTEANVRADDGAN